MSNYIDDIACKIASRFGESPTNLYRLYALLALTTGENTMPEDVHNAWSVWRADTKPDHKSLVPFDELPLEVRDLDAPYAAAIREVARSL